METITGYFTGGIFTKQIPRATLKELKSLVTEPSIDHQPLTKTFSVNPQTIALYKSHSHWFYVDFVMLCNAVNLLMLAADSGTSSASYGTISHEH